MKKDISSIKIVGAGLAGTLLGTEILKLEPACDLQIFDRKENFDLQRTWSFHLTDVESKRVNLEDFIDNKWDSYDVLFPRFARTINLSYASIRGESYYRKLSDKLKKAIFFGEVVHREKKQISKDEIWINATGADVKNNASKGFQKFLGLHLSCSESHDLSRPILMDCRISQKGEFRFMYVLPWTEQDLLIEYTVYSLSSEINEMEYEQEIFQYAKRRGWKIHKELSRERGALVIPLEMPPTPSPSYSFSVGLAKGRFHFVTGYSLPSIVHDIDLFFSRLNNRTGENFNRPRNASFFLKLNRLIFFSAQPGKQYKMLEHFYRLPINVIRRFYADEITLVDKFRFFVGRPPVSPFSALRAIFLKESLTSIKAQENHATK